jgi:hypothetical protein
MHLKEAGKNGLRPDILLRRNHPITPSIMIAVVEFPSIIDGLSISSS